MQATPYPTCIEVQPVLARLVGENIAQGMARGGPAQDRPGSRAARIYRNCWDRR